MRSLLPAGVLLILAGMFAIILGSLDGSGVSSGGFILIGPFPIVFGTGPNGQSLALASVVVGVLMVVLLGLFSAGFFRRRVR